MDAQPHDLKDELLKTDEEFHDLAAKHHELEDRLHELTAKHYLSEPEQVEEVTLKKRKLQLKDRMEDILRKPPARTRARISVRMPRGRACRRARQTPFPHHASRSRRAAVHRRRAAARAGIAVSRSAGCLPSCSSRLSGFFVVLLSRSGALAARRLARRARRARAGRRPRAGGRTGANPVRRRPGAWQQISIFLSPMDVHVNRMPVSGQVTRVTYSPGKFLPAYRHDAASSNERSEIWIDHGGQTVVARQIVGILARRVVCRAEVGRRGSRRATGSAS